MKATDSEEEALLDDVRAHDAAVSGLETPIWLGAEPTFTRSESQDAVWLYEAEGGDKEEVARALLVALAERLGPHVRVTRAVGRHYPEEEAPRFAYGAAWRRDGTALEPWCDAPFDLDADHAAGVPPPEPSPELAWLTVTPDPGVVEVNLAPAPDLATFARWSQDVDEAARAAGLSAVRCRYNGDLVDSGGGGQLTLGGPTPALSPFFARPRLLPGLLRFFNRHPSLSYWFAMECIGSAGQGPRVDEGVRERFEELAVTLDRLARVGDLALTPELLWQSVAPLLVDGAGNSHRAEINVEKLWNPHLPRRGMLGLVEFRALRMEPTPARRVAVAALWRSLAAYLADAPYEEPIIDWGGALHDRFALPTLLLADLDAVLAELDAAGLAPGAALSALLRTPPAPLASLERGGAALTLTPAREFWPLVGDVASQERRSARVVDSSTRRTEVLVRTPAGSDPGVVGAGASSQDEGGAVVHFEIPLQRISSDDGFDTFIAALRYRAFVPSPGFHPELAALDPLVVTWRRAGVVIEVALHAWKPGGGAYDGLPTNERDAAARREERVRITTHAHGTSPNEPRSQRSPPRPLPEHARPAGLTVDLRRAFA